MTAKTFRRKFFKPVLFYHIIYCKYYGNYKANLFPIAVFFIQKVQKIGEIIR